MQAIASLALDKNNRSKERFIFAQETLTSALAANLYHATGKSALILLESVPLWF
jgi:hypothetical protein